MCLEVESLVEALACVGYWGVLSAEDVVMIVVVDAVEHNKYEQEIQVVAAVAHVVEGDVQLTYVQVEAMGKTNYMPAMVCTLVAMTEKSVEDAVALVSAVVVVAVLAVVDVDYR